MNMLFHRICYETFGAHEWIQQFGAWRHRPSARPSSLRSSKSSRPSRLFSRSEHCGAGARQPLVRSRPFSQTLGTALGDWLAGTGGLGYEGGAIVFAAGLAAVVGLYLWTNVSRVLIFWAASILTRPLGSTVGDFLDKPVSNGGL